jgi:hypothetical protein
MGSMSNAIRAAAGLAVAAGALALTGATAQASEGRPQPGYWEVTNQASFGKTKVEHRCLVAAEIDKFLTNPENSHYSCTYPQKQVGGGKIALKGSCVDKNGQTAKVAANGTYAPAAFHMDLDIQAQLVGLPISAGATTDAHRLGDSCPADAIRSKAAKAEEGHPGER